MDSTRIRLAHRASGAVLGAFLLAHMANHLMALAGAAAHRQMLDALRVVYRFPPAEALLIACVLVQIVSGLRMLLRGWGKWRSGIRRAQFLSGAYLAFFLVVHVSAVMIARGVMGIDTDLTFATGAYYDSPLRVVLVPYYILAVLSLGVHAACAFNNAKKLRSSFFLREISDLKK